MIVIIPEMTKGAILHKKISGKFNRIPGDFSNWTVNSIYTHWLIQIVKENTGFVLSIVVDGEMERPSVVLSSGFWANKDIDIQAIPLQG